MSEITFAEMQKAFGDCLSNVASSDDEGDEKGIAEAQEDTELRKPSKDVKPSRVMGRIFRTIQQHMECFG
jgi:hypothetical protein